MGINVAGVQGSVGDPRFSPTQQQVRESAVFGVAQPATGNQGFGQATASGATAATGGPVQGASLTTGMGINVVGVQGSVGDPRSSPTQQQVLESAVFGVAQPATGNQGFGQATASGATAATGGPVQGASPTTGMGINVAGVQGSVGDPRSSPTRQQVRESAVFGVAQPATGNQGFGQATASGTTAATGGPVQGASPTRGMGINVAGVQGSVGDPRSSPTTGLPQVEVQPDGPSTSGYPGEQRLLSNLLRMELQEQSFW
jgi:hypothetical protein